MVSYHVIVHYFFMEIIARQHPSQNGSTSSVETVVFDPPEVLVLPGASTGAIKLWDLEEGNRHRLNCTAVKFHPIGEFFASESSDANLKIWDFRKKGCLHTYKAHTQGVSTIKFSPDSSWVVSGGADNVVKFKCHVGQIWSIEFHPMEFLLATGMGKATAGVKEVDNQDAYLQLSVTILSKAC
ncbi:hypothetical protein MKX01_039424 [Papaver californicum]|nr:hypothetical protein MKX01_039424 [Papaver californicum]